MNADDQLSTWAKYVISGKGRPASRNSAEDLNYRGDTMFFNSQWPVSRIIMGLHSHVCISRAGRFPSHPDCARVTTLCTGVFSAVPGDRVAEGHPLTERLRYLWTARCWDELETAAGMPDSVLFHGITSKSAQLPIETSIGMLASNYNTYHTLVVGPKYEPFPPLIVKKLRELGVARRKVWFSKEAVAERERKAATKSARTAFGLGH